MKWSAVAIGMAGLFAVAMPLRAEPAVWHGKEFRSWKPAYPLELLKADGSRFCLEGLRGNIVLLSFGFVRCPSVCPSILANLAAVRRGLPPGECGRVCVVFVSVDEKDTPADLARYLEMFDSGFIGLTGSRSNVAKAARAYGVVYGNEKNVNGGVLIDHSTDTLVIDPLGRLRLSYSMDQLRDHTAVSADLLRILLE